MANETAQRLLGFRLSDCYRRLIEEVIEDDELLELIHDTRADKNTRTKRLIERDDPAGNKRLSLQVIVSCVLDNNGDVLGVVVVIHDITAEKELARMKDEFVNSVSHELKTPLTSIGAYSEMLADDDHLTDQARRKFARIIQEQTYRLDRLINDMLNISRIESGTWKVHWEQLDLGQIAEDVITTISPQAQDKDIRLELIGRKETDDEPEQAQVSAWGDRDMIFQAVMNLVSNAIKYSPEQRTVTVRLWAQPSGDAAIAVEDAGAGIPNDCLERIFEKFYRVEQNSHMANGTGLGLSLVRQIVETVHGGTVAVKSSTDEGSTFTLFLPVGRRREAEHAERPKEGVGSR
jgi:two-component system phosphate regulon sensor histidine kinase PhoR